MTTKTRAVVLISGSGSNLQAFIDQIDQAVLDIDIVLVISNQRNAYGLTRASAAGINSVCIDHNKFATRLDFDKELIKHIDNAKANVVILAGFMRILTEHFVDQYPNKLINIHPSLLPDYPGNNTHKRVLAAGETWHGVSIHFVVPEVDAGPVILQGRLKVKADDTEHSLQQRIHQIEHTLYPQAIQWFAQDRLAVRNNRVLLDGKSSDDQRQTFDV